MDELRQFEHTDLYADSLPVTETSSKADQVNGGFDRCGTAVCSFAANSVCDYQIGFLRPLSSHAMNRSRARLQPTTNRPFQALILI